MSFLSIILTLLIIDLLIGMTTGEMILIGILLAVLS